MPLQLAKGTRVAPLELDLQIRKEVVCIGRVELSRTAADYREEDSRDLKPVRLPNLQQTL